MSIDWQRVGRVVFGGEGPKENERRYMANAELRDIADFTHPWTVEALESAVREWLERGA